MGCGDKVTQPSVYSGATTGGPVSGADARRRDVQQKEQEMVNKVFGVNGLGGAISVPNEIGRGPAGSLLRPAVKVPRIKNLTITLSPQDARILMEKVLGPQPLLYPLYRQLSIALNGV